MKIYIATSWKLEHIAIALAARLRADGHEVDCFCDPSSGRTVFNFSDLDPRPNEDAKSMMFDPRVEAAFIEDKRWLDWAEAVVLVLPSGRSAHLEAGYAAGRGKRLFIWGDLVPGEFDVMYGFADMMFRPHEVDQLLWALKGAEGRSGDSGD